MASTGENSSRGPNEEVRRSPSGAAEVSSGSESVIDLNEPIAEDRKDEYQTSSSSGFSDDEDSETGSDSSGEAGRFLVKSQRVVNLEPVERRAGDVEPSSVPNQEPRAELEDELDEVDVLDDFQRFEPREVDLKMVPAVEVPRDFSWVSDTVLFETSQYRRGENMGHVISKMNRRGFLFDVDGMEKDDHVAVWPGSLRFTMYDIVVSEMHILPPFTKFQQSVLGRLDVAPSQFHPNAWAFCKAYELMCLFLGRSVSLDLFFHLFEVNRNNDGPDHRHISLRAKRGNKIFRPYSESVQGNWSELFYFVTPLNDQTIQHVGKLEDETNSLGMTRKVLQSTKFPIGWRASHYNRAPAFYHIPTDWLLSNEDKGTKILLQRIEAEIPYKLPRHRGIPVKEICKAVTKSEVQVVLDTMAPRGNLAFLKGLLEEDEVVGETVGVQEHGIPAPDLENVEQAEPLTQVRVGEEARPSNTPVVAPVVVPTSGHVSRKRKGDHAEAGKSKKDKKEKDKASKSKHRSDPVPVDPAFFAKNAEEYQKDPFGAAARLFTHVAEVKQYEMNEFKKKTAADLKDVSDKLEHTRQLYNQRAEQLTLVRNDLTNMTNARDGYKKRAEDAEAKIVDLEAKIVDLESSEKRLSEEVERLRTRVLDLEQQATAGGSPVDPHAEIAALRRQLAAAKEKGARAAKLALEMASEGFENAVSQLQVAYPDLEIDPAVVQADHEVEDGKIVFVDPTTKEKTVVYPLE